jgi:hypothetical protein
VIHAPGRSNGAGALSIEDHRTQSPRFVYELGRISEGHGRRSRSRAVKRGQPRRRDAASLAALRPWSLGPCPCATSTAAGSRGGSSARGRASVGVGNQIPRAVLPTFARRDVLTFAGSATAVFAPGPSRAWGSLRGEGSGRIPRCRHVYISPEVYKFRDKGCSMCPQTPPMQQRGEGPPNFDPPPPSG